MERFNFLKDYLILNHPIYKDVIFVEIIKYIERNILKNLKNKKYTTKVLILKKGDIYKYYLLEHFKIHGFNVNLYDNVMFISINIKLIKY